MICVSDWRVHWQPECNEQRERDERRDRSARRKKWWVWCALIRSSSRSPFIRLALYALPARWASLLLLSGRTIQCKSSLFVCHSHTEEGGKKIEREEEANASNRQTSKWSRKLAKSVAIEFCVWLPKVAVKYVSFLFAFNSNCNCQTVPMKHTRCWYTSIYPFTS